MNSSESRTAMWAALKNHNNKLNVPFQLGRVKIFPALIHGLCVVWKSLGYVEFIPIIIIIIFFTIIVIVIIIIIVIVNNYLPIMEFVLFGRAWWMSYLTSSQVSDCKILIFTIVNDCNNCP